MDKQTAIDLLDNLLGMVEDNHESDYDTAIHMGIDAIKALPSVQPQQVTGKLNDCISRQAAIDASCTCHGGKHCNHYPCKDVQAIMDLPSVQPQRWIPVSEAVPEPDERVAVTTGGYEYHVWDCMSNRGDDYFWEDEEGYYHNKYAVDAWMPLPEPWRGGQDGTT